MIPSPVRVRLSDYYEVGQNLFKRSNIESFCGFLQVDSVGECDTRGVRPRRLENRGNNTHIPFPLAGAWVTICCS